ncbi:MAG: hypothetical protein LBD77_03830 [Bifidobacteriaceae bacterium]|nr:hypothetical protein [Bifidobacteriaceae bacterium]
MSLPESGTAAYNQWQSEAFAVKEDELAKCMKAEGFEYTPRQWVDYEAYTPQGTFSDGDLLWLPWLPETREQVAARGYGKGDPEMISAGAEQDVDPVNYAYKQSLSADALAAYDSASAECVARIEPVLEDRIPSAPAQPNQDFSWQFGELVAAMDQLNWPGVSETAEARLLNGEYSDCMSKAGYDLDSGAEFGPAEVTPWAAEAMARRTKADGSLGESWFNQPVSLGGPLPPEEERSLLGAPGEIAIALADFDCRATTDYEARLLAVYLRLETEFVEQHKTELEAMKAFVEGITDANRATPTS